MLLSLIPTGINKVLSKIVKEKGNEDFQAWVNHCERHLYWSTTSTSDGNGKVIWAKFKSFLSHIVNNHTNLDDSLFNKCAHGDIGHGLIHVELMVLSTYLCSMVLQSGARF